MNYITDQCKVWKHLYNVSRPGGSLHACKHEPREPEKLYSMPLEALCHCEAPSDRTSACAALASSRRLVLSSWVPAFCSIGCAGASTSDEQLPKHTRTRTLLSKGTRASACKHRAGRRFEQSCFHTSCTGTGPPAYHSSSLSLCSDHGRPWQGSHPSRLDAAITRQAKASAANQLRPGACCPLEG